MTKKTPKKPSKESKLKEEKKPWIEIAQNPEDQTWHWLLWSKSGRKIAMSVEGKKRRVDVLKSVKSLKCLFEEATTLQIHPD